MSPTKSNPGLPARASGFSLVELMVAIAVSLILLAGVYQIYISTKTSYRLEEGLARLQENSRFAMEFIARDARMAGYTGCYTGSLSNIESILNGSGFGWDLQKPVDGNEYTGSSTWTPPLDAVISAQVADGSDVLIIRRMAGNGIRLVSPYSDSAQLFIDPAYSGMFSEGDILMVSDCTKASIFQATNVQSAGGKINIVHSTSGSVSPGNITPLLSNSYGEAAEVTKFITHAYFVGNGANGPALMRARLSNTGGNAGITVEELVEGVESLQVRYGIDTDNDRTPNKFVDRDAVSDLNQVVALRIGLLLRTPEEVSTETDTSTYTLLGESIDPTDDRRVRRTLVFTVGIRNRLQ